MFIVIDSFIFSLSLKIFHYPADILTRVPKDIIYKNVYYGFINNSKQLKNN